MRTIASVRSLFGVLVTLAAGASAASATEYHVDTTAQNEVRFISKASSEEFEGTTRHIDGYVFWKGGTLTPGDSLVKGEVHLEVELNTLSTGIDMRDRHMRDDYLHTKEHPLAMYTGKITTITQGPLDTLLVSSLGTLELNGCKKDYRMICAVTGTPAAYHVKTEFDVKLSKFNIKVPSLMFLKISELINVLVNVNVVPVD